jgi:hypothetical protein
MKRPFLDGASRRRIWDWAVIGSFELVCMLRGDVGRRLRREQDYSLSKAYSGLLGEPRYEWQGIQYTISRRPIPDAQNFDLAARAGQ